MEQLQHALDVVYALRWVMTVMTFLGLLGWLSIVVAQRNDAERRVAELEAKKAARPHVVALPPRQEATR